MGVVVDGCVVCDWFVFAGPHSCVCVEWTGWLGWTVLCLMT